MGGIRNSRREVSRALLEQEDESQRLRKENRELKEEQEGAQVEIQRLKRENYDLKSDCKILQKRMQEFGDVDKLQRELNQKSIKLQKLQEELIENDRLLQRFEDELDNKNRKMTKLNITVGSKNEEIDQLKFRLNEYQKRGQKINQKDTRVMILVKEKETLILEMEKLRRQNEGLRKDLQEKPKVEKVEVPVHNASFGSDGEDTERIRVLEVKLDDLMELIRRLRKENKELREKYEDALKEVNLWKQRRDEIAEKYSELEGLLEEKKKEIMRKIFTISMLSVKISVLLFGLRHRTNEYKQLQAKM
jgi:chromosome segregation ATPase